MVESVVKKHPGVSDKLGILPNSCCCISMIERPLQFSRLSPTQRQAGAAPVHEPEMAPAIELELGASVAVSGEPSGRDEATANVRSPLTSLTLAKLEKRLRKLTGKAVVEYNMIEDGDRVMVCLSGGKDSYTLLDMLLHLQRVAPISFELAVVNLDQKQPGFPQHILPEYLCSQSVNFHVIERDTYSVVKRVVPEGQTTCALCSRLRRGTLYGFASSMGYNKIALGHHRDDIVETLFLNLFHGGKLQAMPPKLLSDDGQHMVIRPLAMVPETLIEAYAEKRRFPIIPCDLCGSQPNLQRAKIKAMLRQWESEFPGRTESIFSAIRDVRPSQLADLNLFDFVALKRDSSAE